MSSDEERALAAVEAVEENLSELDAAFALVQEADDLTVEQYEFILLSVQKARAQLEEQSARIDDEIRRRKASLK